MGGGDRVTGATTPCQANRTIHTNTVEGAFSLFKLGMSGVYQHCGEQHLHRYLAEFEFRYNSRVALGVDGRARAAVAGVGGSASPIGGITRKPEKSNRFQQLSFKFMESNEDSCRKLRKRVRRAR